MLYISSFARSFIVIRHHLAHARAHPLRSAGTSMTRALEIVAVGLLAVSLPQRAFGMSIKQKQRNACSGRRSGDVSSRYSKRKTFGHKIDCVYILGSSPTCRQRSSPRLGRSLLSSSLCSKGASTRCSVTRTSHQNATRVV